MFESLEGIYFSTARVKILPGPFAKALSVKTRIEEPFPLKALRSTLLVHSNETLLIGMESDAGKIQWIHFMDSKCISERQNS